MPKLLKIRHACKGSIQQQGFTLPELLIAATISLGVVSLGGFGLVSILTSSQVANAQNERKTELNRSLEFISTEIRQSGKIEKNAVATTLPSEFSLPAGAQPVLMLFPEISSTIPIIYYVGSPSPSDNTWRGPKVVYRWGPQYSDDGDYQNLSTPATWTAEPLIDAIDDNNAVPTCSGAWNANGTLGFGACVNESGKVAELYHAGIFNKPIQGTEVYTAQTTTIARSARASPSSFEPPDGASLDFTITDGGVTIRKPSTMNIKVLGGEITCDTGGIEKIPTTSAYNLIQGDTVTQSPLSTNPPSAQNDISVAEDTVLTVDGQSTGGPCDVNISANSKADNLGQVLTLKNGDAVPDYAPFGDQRPIQDFLDSYINTDQQVTIADNEVIFLFELGNTDTDSDSFDMQDLVVLATITPN